MVAIYDYTNFPIVKVDLSGNITTDDDFQNFTSQWLELCKLKTDFEFEFNTINTGYINPIYCLYTAFFIKSIKQQTPQYLKKSKTLLNSEVITITCRLSDLLISEVTSTYTFTNTST